MVKKTKPNSKGFYKQGRLTFRDYQDGRTVLFALGRIENADFISYIREVDRVTDGKYAAHDVLSNLAVAAFERGFRVAGVETK